MLKVARSGDDPGAGAGSVLGFHPEDGVRGTVGPMLNGKPCACAGQTSAACSRSTARTSPRVSDSAFSRAAWSNAVSSLAASISASSCFDQVILERPREQSEHIGL